jgi:hypothetical protein
VGKRRANSFLLMRMGEKRKGYKPFPTYGGERERRRGYKPFPTYGGERGGGRVVNPSLLGVGKRRENPFLLVGNRTKS